MVVNWVMQDIRRFRENQTPPLTQEQLGELLGVTGVSVSRFESGKRRPSDQVALKLEGLTGIDFKVLRGLIPSQEESKA
jgi:transcriptional regulator with XRE-family HTH domain